MLHQAWAYIGMQQVTLKINTTSGPAFQQPKQHHPQLNTGTSLLHGPGWRESCCWHPKHPSLTCQLAAVAFWVLLRPGFEAGQVVRQCTAQCPACRAETPTHSRVSARV